jgi:hypothetical protein
MSVRSDQHGRGRSDLANDRQLPRAMVPGVEQPDAIRPTSNVETAGFTAVEDTAVHCSASYVSGRECIALSGSSQNAERALNSPIVWTVPRSGCDGIDRPSSRRAGGRDERS